MEEEEGDPSPAPPLPLPQTLPDLEALIQRFYGLNTPQQYTQIDSALKCVQKTHGAFALADQLMGSADANVRFFGALTFTVKVNRDWTSLTAAEGKDLLDRLLFWFVRCVNGRDVSLVVRKLCAALVAVFKQTAGEWMFCVRHAVACLVSDSVVGYNALLTPAEENQVRLLTESQATACLWLGSTLVEELSKMEVAGAESQSFLRAGSQNIPALLDLVEHCLASDKISLLQDGIKLVHTIRLSSQSLAHDDDTSKKRLSDLVLGIVSRLAADDMLTVIADLAMDIMAKDQGRSVAQLVATKILEPQFDRYQKELLDGNFNDESLLYGRLIVTIAGTWLDEQPNENSWKLPHLDDILERLVLLAGAQGYAVEDDTLISEIIDFWSVYVEWAVDLCSADGQNETRDWWIAQSRNNASQVLEMLLGKLQMPSLDVFAHWERQVQYEFRSLRRDFRDFSASAYTLLGTRMLSTLIDYLLRLWAEHNWSGAEITLQCLKGVVETAVETKDSDNVFLAFLDSPIFSMADEDTIPLNVRQASIELLADCSPLFERQTDPPTHILQWLFQCISQGRLSLPAAKAISSVCDACRKRISSEAQGLANLWCNLAADSTQPSEVLERLAQAVGAVCQALWAQTKHKSERSSAIQALDSLLQTVLHQIQFAGMDDNPQCRDRRMTALQSLLNITRSFHESDDEIVDLDSTENNAKHSDPITLQWAAARQQDFVTTLTTLLQNYPSDGDLMEAICLLLRAGMTDNLDNPFRLDEKLLVCLVRAYLSTTPRPQLLLETVSRWLRQSYSWVKNGVVDSSARKRVASVCVDEAIQCLATMYYAQDGPSNHAEHIASVLDFVAAYIPLDLDLLAITQETLHAFAATAGIAISCFALPEPILKQAASKFWTQLLDLRPEPSSTTSDAKTQILSLIVPLLPHLTMTLTHALSGHAARSEIEMLVLPFRKMIVFPITRHLAASMNGGNGHRASSSATNIPDTRMMLSTALFDPTFPSTRVSEAQKRMFLEKVLRLRGESGTTTRVCREWWIACRGTFS